MRKRCFATGEDMRIQNRSALVGATTAALMAMLLTACGMQEDQHLPTTSNLSIIGGTDVPATQQDARFWSTVALTTDFARSSDQPSTLDQGHSFCTGTIVNARTIVTAAHCLQQFDAQTRRKLPDLILPQQTDFLIYFGTNVARTGTWIRAQKIIPHPDWDPNQTLTPNPTSAPHDIGVVILSADIPNSHRSVKIADSSIQLSNGQETFLAGYGVTRNRNQNDTGTLRQVTTPISASDANSKRFTVGEFFRGACAGDSGGPAYIKVNGELQVAGATSTGAELAGNCLGLMNNYTDVRFYKNWIESVSLSETGLSL